MTSPYGQSATGAPDEESLPRDPAERLIVALRLVAERCLYGVDINPMAVEMAKLSLWLATVQKDRPFTFLDHALRHGDSLVGIHAQDQLLYWSLEQEGLHNQVVFHRQLEEALEYARKKRRELIGLEDRTIEAVEAKARLLAEAERATELLRLGADLVIATAFGADDLLADYSVVMEAAQQLRPDGARGSIPLTRFGRSDIEHAYAKLREQGEQAAQGAHAFPLAAGVSGSLRRHGRKSAGKLGQRRSHSVGAVCR